MLPRPNFSPPPSWLLFGGFKGINQSISQSVNQWMKMFLTIYFPLKQQRGRMFPFSKTAFLLIFFFKLQRKLTSCPSLFWDVSLNGQRLNEKAIFFIEEHKMLGWPNRCIRFTKIRKHCPLFKVNQKENTFFIYSRFTFSERWWWSLHEPSQQHCAPWV